MNDMTTWEAIRAYGYIAAIIGIIAGLAARFVIEAWKIHRPKGFGDGGTIPSGRIRQSPNNRRLTGSEEERELIMRQLCSPGWRRPILFNDQPCPYCRDIVPAHERWCPMVEPTLK